MSLKKKSQLSKAVINAGLALLPLIVTPDALAKGGHHSHSSGSGPSTMDYSSHSHSTTYYAGSSGRSYSAGWRQKPQTTEYPSTPSHTANIDYPSTSSKAATGVARDSHGRIARSEHAKDEFKKISPCPSTGESSGACPGYVIDHVKPLKRGGADAPSNMQWQTKAAAKAKDRWE